MNEVTFLLDLLLLGIFIALTHPLELRSWRWTKIGFSLVLVTFISTQTLFSVSGGLSFIIGFVALAFLWGPNLAHLASGRLVYFLTGDANPSAGFRPDFREARGKMKAEIWLEAIPLIQHELNKDPINFEGLMLMVEAYRNAAQPNQAIPHLDRIIHGPEFTPDQQQLAYAEKIRCLAQQQSQRD